MGCDLHGLRMPELRSGARRSKRLDNLQPSPLPFEQPEDCVLPAQTRTRRRGGGGGGRGRGSNASAVGKGRTPATRATGAGRGRGIRIIDLDPEPCEAIPEVAALGAAEPAFNQVEVVGEKDIAMEGGSADKAMGVEEEASTTPVPDRVASALAFYFFLLFLIFEACILKIFQFPIQFLGFIFLLPLLWLVYYLQECTCVNLYVFFIVL